MPARSQSWTHRSGSARFDSFSRRGHEPKSILLWCVDAGFLGALLILPFVWGGRQALGEFTLVVIASWTAFAWMLHSSVGSEVRWRISGLEPVLLAAVGLGVLQTLALPPEWLDALSPHIDRLLPLWQGAFDQEGALTLVDGHWSSISLVPAATRSSLCCVIAVALMFVIGVQRIHTVADAALLLRLFAVAATAMALFGIFQLLFGNGRFYGFYDHPFTHTRDYAKGAFTNPNHFGSFLAMAIPVLLAWYATETQKSDRHAYNPYPTARERLVRLSGPAALVGLAIVSVGVLLSQSRGALVTACVGAIVTLVLLWRRRLLSMTAAGTIGGISLVALVSLTFFSAHIQSLVEHNFHELVSGDLQQLDRSDARRKIWEAAVKGISDYPVLGTGISSHREVYWTYFNHPEIDGEYSHAENGYLQLALETGFTGVGIAAAALLMIAFWCVRGLFRSASPEAAAILAAITGAFAVNLVHSLTDFVWYVPSCMTVLALMAACASRLDRLAAPKAPSEAGPVSLARRGLPLLGAVGVLALAAWMVHVKRPAIAAESFWFDYVRIIRSEDKLQDEFDREEFERHKLETVLAAAEADPTNCRVQLRAAAAALTIFGNQRAEDPAKMSLANIRDAARMSEWESPEQLQEWLNNPGVLGDRSGLDEAWERTQHALSLCPLLAEGYIRLAELSWLYGGTRREEDTLLVQALLVRPYDAGVHFAAGREAWLRGKQSAALEHWKCAFHQDAEYQQLVIELLSAAVPAQFFLKHFDPDASALARLREAYRDSQDVEGFRSICLALGEQLSEQAAQARHKKAVQLWQKAHDAYLEIDDQTNARLTAEAAVEADPNSYGAHYLLAQWLYANQHYPEARKHLEFCYLRRPHDDAIKRLLDVTMRESQSPISRVAAESPSRFSDRRL